MRGRLRRPSLYLLLAALALAAALRLWRLDSLPPGLYHDEAYYGLDALALLQGETFPRFHEGWELYAADAHQGNPPAPTRWPVFFEGNYGREPLHIYLVALSIALLGPSPLAIRLVPALAGVLAVLTTYLAATALLPRRWLPEAPLAAAFALSLFVPAIQFSRFGVRAMTFLPVASLCVYAFWRAFSSDSERPAAYVWFALAGLLLGLSAYTYVTARLFALLFLLFVLLWLGRDRQRWQQRFPAIALMALVSAVVAGPLLFFFARYPYFFTFRIGYVSDHGSGVVPGKPWLTWLYNGGRVLRGLFWYGETHLRHNLPGRPYLDPVQAGLVLLGLAAPLQAIWRREERDTWLRWLFLALWLLFMLLPSVMSGDAPHFGRLSGVAAPLAILAGLGLTVLLRWLGERISRPVTLGAAALLLLVSAFFTVRDYFQRYATHPELPAAFYEEERRLGQYAASQLENADPYLSPTQEEMATLYFAVGGARTLMSFGGPDGALPLGRPGREALYLLRQPSPEQLAALTARQPGAVAEEEVAGGVIPVRAAPPVAPGEPLATWAGAIALAGWSAERDGEQLAVTLRWQSLARVVRSYTVFVHLLDEDDEIVAQEDRPPAGYPTTDWRPSELVEDRFLISLPADLPAGSYRIRTGFYVPGPDGLLGSPVILEEPVVIP